MSFPNFIYYCRTFGREEEEEEQEDLAVGRGRWRETERGRGREREREEIHATNTHKLSLNNSAATQSTVIKTKARQLNITHGTDMAEMIGRASSRFESSRVESQHSVFVFVFVVFLVAAATASALIIFQFQCTRYSVQCTSLN